MKTIAFLPAHPSQVWLLRSVQPYIELSSQFKVQWVIRDKDISCELADELGIDYVRISKAATGVWGNAVEMCGNIFKCLSLGRKLKIDCWVTKYGSGNIAAYFSGIKSVSFNDDDIDQVPLIAHTSYPFAKSVLCPDVVRMGKYEKKSIRYAGCHELFYLHPNRFQPDKSVLEELGIEQGKRFILVRLSALTAHHDKGIRGLSGDAIQQVLALCHKHGIQCFISSEKKLPDALMQYRLSIPVNRVHHVLAFASVFVGDSQTMTSEAAVLGTPAIRFSDFTGRLSVIDEIEKYQLAFGISPDEPFKLVEIVERYLLGEGKEVFKEHHALFLREKIDPAPWFAEQILNIMEAE
jgi:uncharacterized protein